MADQPVRSVFFNKNLTKRQKTTRRIAVTLGAIAVLGGGTVRIARLSGSANAEPADPTAGESALPVAVMTVSEQSGFDFERSYSGLIVPRRRSAIAFERAGLLVEVAADDGQRVGAGAIIARLDTALLDTHRAELIAQRDAARAVLAEMESGPRRETIAAASAVVRERIANHAFWSRELSRFSQLAEAGQATRKEHDDAISQERMARAQLDAARAALEELENGTRAEQIAAQRARVAQLVAAIARVDVDIAKSVIRAPFAGRVARRLVDEGTVVSAGQGVIELIEDGALEARIGVPADVLATVALGKTYPVRVGAGEHPGELTAILPELDAATRTVTLVVTLDAEHSADVVPQRVARLSLNERLNQPGFWLPLAGLVKGERGLWSVYALEHADGEYGLARRDVEVLYTDGARAYVRGLLSDGEQVVAAGAHRVVAGQRVTIAD